MKNKKLFLGLLCCLALTAITCRDSLREIGKVGNPSQLTYLPVMDAREGVGVSTVRPTVNTGGLLPEFEIVSVRTEDGAPMDASLMQYISIAGTIPVDISVNPPEHIVDEEGNRITSVTAVNSANNGVISVAFGHTLPPGDYYFTIRVSTQDGDVHYSAVFDDAFHLRINPLLPDRMIYSPKNQNLVYGDPDGKTSAPIVPGGNPDISFALGNYLDKLVIDGTTGEISLAPGYVYSGRESLDMTVHAVSNISGEVVAFEEVLTIVITDTPEEMPLETIYFFYPTLNTSVANPSGGNGFTVQSVKAGVAPRIWGFANNSAGTALVAPEERPAGNTGQTILMTQTQLPGTPATTQPVSLWLVTSTQDLTPFQYGQKLSFHYYYQGAYVNYLSDGRTPTDLEVYISMDYTGGDIQDADGNWLNGTWVKVNEEVRCRLSLGVSGAISIGAPWGPEFIGTPYPGDQNGADPDGRKTPGTTYYNKWLQCAYDISVDKISPTFTVAFKVASYFEGEIQFNGTPPGRGGTYFLSDFHYKAVESN